MWADPEAVPHSTRYSISIIRMAAMDPGVFRNLACGDPAEPVQSSQSETALRYVRSSPKSGHSASDVRAEVSLSLKEAKAFSASSRTQLRYSRLMAPKSIF